MFCQYLCITSKEYADTTCKQKPDIQHIAKR